MCAAKRTDDACSDRLAHPKGVAHSEYPVAYFQALGLGKGNGGQVGSIDLEHSKIGFRVSPDYTGGQGAPVGQCNLNLIGGYHYMMIGQDVAIGTDDDPRSEVGCLARLGVQTVTKKIAENRIFQRRMGWVTYFLLGKNIDYCRDDFGCRRCERFTGRRHACGRLLRLVNGERL